MRTLVLFRSLIGLDPGWDRLPSPQCTTLADLLLWCFGCDSSQLLRRMAGVYELAAQRVNQSQKNACLGRLSVARMVAGAVHHCPMSGGALGFQNS